MSNIINFYKLEESYPKGEFENVCGNAKDKSLLIHYAIVFQQFPRYKNYIEKNLISIDINRPHTKRKIFPIHLATIKGDIDALKFLSSNEKTDWNAQDEKGWNIMHHALIGFNQSTIDFLMKNVKMASELMETKNNEGLTPTQMLECTRIPSQEKVTFFHLKSTTGKIEKSDGTVFKGLTKANLLNRYLMTPFTIVENWLTHEKIENIDLSYYIDNLKKILEGKGPCIYLADHKKINGLGLFTDEDIESGKFIDVYYGQRDCTKSIMDIHNDYLLFDIDPTKNGGVMMMANDGFPNMAVYGILYGQTDYSTFTSLGVKKGEELFWNYGSGHNIKINRYVELNKEALNLFCESSSPKKIFLDRVNNENDSLALESQLITDQVIKLIYLLDTPSALMRVLLENRVNAKELSELIKDKMFHELFNNAGGKLVRVFQHIVINLGLQFQEGLLKENQTTFSELFSDLLNKYSVAASILALNWVVNRDKGFNSLSIEETQQKCDLLASEIQSLIDWYHSCEDGDDISSHFTQFKQMLKKCKGASVKDYIEFLLSYNDYYPKRIRAKAILEGLGPLYFKTGSIENEKQLRKMKVSAEIIYKVYQLITQYKPEDRDLYIKTFKNHLKDLKEIGKEFTENFEKQANRIVQFIQNGYPEQIKIVNNFL